LGRLVYGKNKNRNICSRTNARRLETRCQHSSPAKAGAIPVIMAFTCFGKDDFWSEKHFGWQIAYEPGSPTLTGLTTFEANNPAF
jgi:hypothetical protein